MFSSYLNIDRRLPCVLIQQRAIHTICLPPPLSLSLYVCVGRRELTDNGQVENQVLCCGCQLVAEASQCSVEDGDLNLKPETKPCLRCLQRENFSTEFIESISPENLQSIVKLCVDGLQSLSIVVKRFAAVKLQLLAKNRADNRALIGESSVVPALIPLLRCSEPWTQEHAVTALLNLLLHKGNKSLITNSGAIKSLVYVLKTGTETSKRNATCALLSLSLIDNNKQSIEFCGATPLVALLLNGSNRGKKDVLTTIYKLCSVKQDKETTVSAGAWWFWCSFSCMV